MYEFWLKDPGPRYPYRQYVRYLWGEAPDCDTDGNSAGAADRQWTELTVVNRRSRSERVDVDPEPDSPLTLRIWSSKEELAAQLAYALALTAGGQLSHSRDGVAVAPESLIPAMGLFDFKASLKWFEAVDS